MLQMSTPKRSRETMNRALQAMMSHSLALPFSLLLCTASGSQLALGSGGRDYDIYFTDFGINQWREEMSQSQDGGASVRM